MPDLRPDARRQRVVAEPGYERWDGGGALGYLVLNAIVEAKLADPPAHARLVVAGRTFPTGMLGYWTRRLADGGLVAVLTATSPRRLGHPDGGPKLTGTNPLSIAIPSSDGRPVVADVSMGNLTYGDVLAGKASEDDLAPFGGEHAHKAFALAVGLQLLVDALTPDDGLRRRAARRAAGERPGAGVSRARRGCPAARRPLRLPRDGSWLTPAARGERFRAWSSLGSSEPPRSLSSRLRSSSGGCRGSR